MTDSKALIHVFRMEREEIVEKIGRHLVKEGEAWDLHHLALFCSAKNMATPFRKSSIKLPGYSISVDSAAAARFFKDICGDVLDASMENLPGYFCDESSADIISASKSFVAKTRLEIGDY